MECNQPQLHKLQTYKPATLYNLASMRLLVRMILLTALATSTKLLAQTDTPSSSGPRVPASPATAIVPNTTRLVAIKTAKPVYPQEALREHLQVR
jgi:hypothetical protein